MHGLSLRIKPIFYLHLTRTINLYEKSIRNLSNLDYNKVDDSSTLDQNKKPSQSKQPSILESKSTFSSSLSISPKTSEHFKTNNSDSNRFSESKSTTQFVSSSKHSCDKVQAKNNRSKNSPFDGRKLEGRVLRTWVNGATVFERG